MWNIQGATARWASAFGVFSELQPGWDMHLESSGRPSQMDICATLSPGSLSRGSSRAARLFHTTIHAAPACSPLPCAPPQSWPPSPGVFANNRASSVLRRDHPTSVVDLVLFNGDDLYWGLTRVSPHNFHPTLSTHCCPSQN